jgi:hypothetical protein
MTKYWLPIGLVLALTACAHNANRDASAAGDGRPVVDIAYLGPENELFPEQRPVGSTHIGFPVMPSDIRQVGLPPTHAVRCNSKKSACSHAMVGTNLRLQVLPLGTGNYQIQGELRSEMGRAVAMEFPAGSGMRFREELLAEVPLIGQEKQTVPFQRTVKLGEPIEVLGLLGSKITIRVVE